VRIQLNAIVNDQWLMINGFAMHRETAKGETHCPELSRGN